MNREIDYPLPLVGNTEIVITLRIFGVEKIGRLGWKECAINKNLITSFLDNIDVSIDDLFSLDFLPQGQEIFQMSFEFIFGRK